MTSYRSGLISGVRHSWLPCSLLCVSLICARAQADGSNSSAPNQSELRASQKLNNDPAANIGEARAHFGRGVQYYQDSDFRAALLEFQRAYALQHAYPLLYNLGQVCAELRDYAAAERYFRTYLAKGGSEIASARRSEVLMELTRLKTRVGSLRISANLSDFEIRIDDQLMKVPASGLMRISAGRRQVVAEKHGYTPVRRVVDVLGGEESSVSLTFGPALAGSSQKDGSANPLPWIVGITSAVMLVGAAGVGYLAYQDSSDYKTALNHVTTQAELDRLSSGARDKALVSDVLLGTGVAGAAVTIILLLTGGTRETASGAETKSSVQLGGRGVTLQF